MISEDDGVPIEFTIEEIKERGQAGQTVVQPKLRIWNSADVNIVEMVSGRWEGCREYSLSWEQLLALHSSISRQIEFLRPHIDNGQIVSK